MPSKTYHPSKMTPLERGVLQVTAFHRAPIAHNRLLKVLKGLGLRAPGGKALSYPLLKKVLDGMLRKAWIEEHDDGQRGLTCRADWLADAVDDAFGGQRLTKLALLASDAEQVSEDWQLPVYNDYRALLRDIHACLVLDEIGRANRLIAYAFREFDEQALREHPVQAIDPRLVDAPWYRLQPAELQRAVLLLLADHAVQHLALGEVVAEALAATDWADAGERRKARSCLVEWTLLAGQEEGVAARVASLERVDAQALRGFSALVQGDIERAREQYELAYQTLRSSTRKRNIGLQGLAGAFSLLPLIAAGELETVARRSDLARREKDSRLEFLYQAYYQYATASVEDDQAPPIRVASRHYLGPIHLLTALLGVWGNRSGPTVEANLDELVERADATGRQWVADQGRALLARLRGTPRPAMNTGRPLVDLVAHKERWERALDALAVLADDGGAGSEGGAEAASEPQERLVWLLDHLDGALIVEPRLQKRGKRGGWSKGRSVALERLARGDVDAADQADQAACRGIETTNPWHWGHSGYDFDPKLVWPALVGHPRLFRHDAPEVPLELVSAGPELHVRRGPDGGMRVSLEPPMPQDLSLRVVEESRGRWLLVEYNERQQGIARLLADGLACPPQAEERLRTMLGQVAPLVNVHSDIGGGSALPLTPGDPRPRVALSPLGDGLAVELLVRPTGTDGPGYPPAAGGAELTARGDDGQRRRVQRDLAAERRLTDALLEGCPVLAGYALDDRHWELPDPAASLTLLEQVQALCDAAGVHPDGRPMVSDPGAADPAGADQGDADTQDDKDSDDPPRFTGPLVVEWPQGQSLRLAGRADGSSMQLALRRNGDWFEASGELTVDEGEVLELQRLLALVAADDSRFLSLGDGRFVALSEHFRRQLADLGALADSGARGKATRYHPLTANLLETIGAELGEFDTDQAWRDRVARLRQVEQAVAELPSTIEAELRDYQVEGYRWMMQLADWGVGACLADDMGLGKTLQSLAVLVARAPLGPSLVVAPTSVAGNWLAEARRFAPTLNPVLYGRGDRDAQVDALGPFDLLIVSYGLMQQDIERLAGREDWNCLFLDEAQAIKNPATRRTRAALKLPAAFRVATTGTPIENHLGELWSLFRFLNPGLLGSLEAFNRRYAGPIERDNDGAVRDRLRRLVRPFILRRLKSSVLQELPPRTEVVLQVEPSAQEGAFYEALRRELVSSFDAADGDGQDQRFRVLAAITRLRRAACNPALVAPEAAVGSAKLALFLETVEELRDGGHKALVFSQFVDHLTLVRNALDERGIRYQYLDGSTSATTRGERVQAFQAGDGELFLISLKAGGTGLNLTAADYVIHLDPWWNPAVEDQASDRAHRIGQQRPVTVYRLVARGTIEERIVDLHQKKRDLADGLLEGGDVAARLDTGELLELMRAED